MDMKDILIICLAISKFIYAQIIDDDRCITFMKICVYKWNLLIISIEFNYNIILIFSMF